jgi:hypothetical protein
MVIGTGAGVGGAVGCASGAVAAVPEPEPEPLVDAALAVLLLGLFAEPDAVVGCCTSGR